MELPTVEFASFDILWGDITYCREKYFETFGLDIHSLFFEFFSSLVICVINSARYSIPLCIILIMRNSIVRSTFRILIAVIAACQGFLILFIFFWISYKQIRYLLHFIVTAKAKPHGLLSKRFSKTSIWPRKNVLISPKTNYSEIR